MTGSIDLASVPLPQLTANVSGNGNAATTPLGGNSVFADLLQAISAVPAGAANTPNTANAALLGLAANASPAGAANTATAPTPTLRDDSPAAAANPDLPSLISNDGPPELFSIDQLQALLKAQVVNTPRLPTPGKQLSTATPTILTNRTTPATAAPDSSQNATLRQADDTTSDPLALETDVPAALVDPQTALTDDTAAPQSPQPNVDPTTALSTPKFAFVDVSALQMAPMAPQDPNNPVQQPSLPLTPAQNGKSDDAREASESDRNELPTTASNDTSQPLVTATIIAGQMAVMVQAPAVQVDVSNSPAASATPDRTNETSGDNNSTEAVSTLLPRSTAKSSVSNASSSLSTNSSKPVDSPDANSPQFDVESDPPRQSQPAAQAQPMPEDSVSVVAPNQVSTTVAQAIAAAQPMSPAQTTRATPSLENVSQSSASHPSDANSGVTITSLRQPAMSVTTPMAQPSTPTTFVLPSQTIITSARTSTVQLPQSQPDKAVLTDINLQVIEQTNQFIQSAGDQESDGVPRGQIAAARHTLPPIAAHEPVSSENFASNLSSTTPLNFSAASAQQPAAPASIVGRILEAIPKPLQATTIVIHADGYGPIQIRISPESSSPDSSWRITIRTSDPAAHALLKESVDEIRQNLKSDAVNIVGTTAATEKTSGPAGSSNNGSSLKDSGQERRQQFEQKNSRNRPRGEVFTIPEIDE